MTSSKPRQKISAYACNNFSISRFLVSIVVVEKLTFYFGLGVIYNFITIFFGAGKSRDKFNKRMVYVWSRDGCIAKPNKHELRLSTKYSTVRLVTSIKSLYNTPSSIEKI